MCCHVFFHLAQCLKFFQVVAYNGLQFFLLLMGIPLYRCISLSIFLLIDMFPE